MCQEKNKNEINRNGARLMNENRAGLEFCGEKKKKRSVLLENFSFPDYLKYR